MAQLLDHRDLLDAYRPGDLLASERIVRVYQNELLRSAFLLCGTADGAIGLARDAFLELFRELMRGSPQDDPRLTLLRHLGRRYLAGEPAATDADNGPGASGALLGSVSFASEAQRYRVDDDRSRVVSALELFERPTRLGLVLREFNALDEEPVCQILDEVPFTLRARLHPARMRLREAAGVGEDGSVRELLITAATLAPRPNLWPEVAGPLEALHLEEEERRQRYTYAAATLVACLLLLAGLWLLDLFPFAGGDDGSDTAAVVTPGPAATATATPMPTITPTAVPDLSSFGIPQGDVPARFAMQVNGNRDGQEIDEAGLYDPSTSTFTPQELDGYPLPSPDGRILIGFVRTDSIGDDSTSTLVASDSASGERLWAVEMPGALYSYVVTLDRMYVATTITTDGSEVPGLLAFDLATGQQVGEWPDLVPDLQTGNTSFIRLNLHASPDGERLFIALEELGSVPTTVSARTLASFHLPDMTFEASSVQSDSTSEGQFPVDFSFSDAHVTPDGSHIYNVGEDVVRFRGARLDEDLDLGLPFSPRSSSAARSDLRWTTSNDGRYLYILAMERGEAAIVDLLARRITRSFSLNLSNAGATLGLVDGVVSPLGTRLGVGAALSPDGALLYVVGGASEPAGVGSTSIWVIDVATWSVVNGRDVPGIVDHIAHLNGALVVHTSLAVTDSAQELRNRILILDPVSLATLEERANEGLPDWVREYQAVSLPELYRGVYGRAPAVEHLAPSDVETESTLPRIAVSASAEAVPAGGALDIDVRELDPVTGERLRGRRSDVRFDPDATVVIRLTHEDEVAEDVILVASRIETGHYRANASFVETGYWSAEITFTNVDGSSWSLSVPRVFEITPSLEGTDGKRYVLRVRTDPMEPTVNEPVPVEAEFVAVGDGEPLPEGVGLRDGMPDELRVSFNASGSGVTSATLVLNDQGVYEGEVSFWAAGDWEATAEIRYSDTNRIDISAGVVTVEPD